MRNRRAEERHDIVAHVFVDVAALVLDGLAEAREAAVHQRMHLLRVELFAELREAAHVREEHGHLAALRRGGLGFFLRNAIEFRAACAAKFEAGGDFSSTTGALHGENLTPPHYHAEKLLGLKTA